MEYTGTSDTNLKAYLIFLKFWYIQPPHNGGICWLADSLVGLHSKAATQMLDEEQSAIQ